MDNQNKTFAELLSGLIEEKDLSISKLASHTGIPEIFLLAILSGDPRNLPAAPYVRGYLFKIAECVDEKGEDLWNAYKKDHSLRSSGLHDRLPPNRFARQKSTSLFFTIGIVIVLLLSCLVYWGIKAIRLPHISIYGPSDNLIANASSIMLSGKVDSADKLLINGEEIASEKSGKFEKEFVLEKGINIFEFKVKRFLGKENKIVRTVIYQPDKKFQATTSIIIETPATTSVSSTSTSQ